MQETREGLELIVLGRNRTLTASIPPEVDPSKGHFTAKMVNEETLQIVYRRGEERKVYEAPIRR